MLSQKERLEADALAVIRDANQPMGSCKLRHILFQMGHDVSEATIGRVLQRFDKHGYTLKVGFKGRSLSPAGRARLARFAVRETNLFWGTNFSEVLLCQRKERLLEVLVARRAIENELAALAAVHGTMAEIQQLYEIVEEQRRGDSAGHVTAKQDADFHAAIARMARNKTLASILGLTRQDNQLTLVLEYIRKRVQSVISIDHDRIFKAIAARQPEQARLAMERHINYIIADIELFWTGAASGN